MATPREDAPRSTLEGGRLTLALVGPGALAFLLLFAAPMGIIGIYALLTPGAQGDPTLPLTLSSLGRSIDPLYLTILLRSLRLALLTTLLTLLIGFPTAWILTEMRGWRRDLVLLLLILPSWTNLLVKNYAWIVLLRQEGVLNTVLVGSGLSDAPLPLLFHEGAVLLGLVHTFLPFMVLPLYAALEKLDPGQIEAARDLGAGWWARLRRIVLPQCAPGIGAGALLVFIPALGSFVTPDLLGGARGMMIGNLIQNQLLLARDWPFAAALALWLTGVSLALILLALRLGRDGAQGGGGNPA